MILAPNPEYNPNYIAGIAAIIVGIVTLTDTSTMLSTRIIPILLMIFGALVFLSSFLGCFGTVTESKGILTAVRLSWLAFNIWAD